MAGAAISWAAHRRGWSVTVVDSSEPESCSRVAAGLVTPITGTRGAASWRWNEYFPLATAHYLACEAATECKFWYSKPALRIFQSQDERERSIERWCREEARDRIPSQVRSEPKMTLCSPEELSGYTAPWGGAWMEPAARLDTQSYLDATLRFMTSQHCVHRAELSLGPDAFSARESRLFVSELNQDFDAVILCQGFASRQNSWFSSLPLHPARGDILTVRLHTSSLPAASKPAAERYQNVVHASSWLVPLGDGEFLTGATYDRQTLDGIVDDREAVQEARQEVLQRVKEYIQLQEGSQEFGGPESEFEVITQRAAVRPASYDRHPLIGQHPDWVQLFVLNGLGSKGTLMAPGLANDICNSIETKTATDPALNWRRLPKRR